MKNQKSNDFIDICVYRYLFFSKWNSSDAKNDRENKGQTIHQILKNAWRWIHEQAEKEIQDLDILKQTDNGRESYTLANTLWMENGDHLFLLEIYSFHDVIYLRFGIQKKGKSELSALSILAEHLSMFAVNLKDQNILRVWIGELKTYYLELEKNELEKSKHKKDITAFFQKDLHVSRLIVESCELDWGFLFFPVSVKIKFPAGCLVYKDEKYIEKATNFVNNLVPRIGLSILKIKINYSVYDLERPKIEEAERNLAKSLKGQEKGGSLNYLEERIKNLSGHQDELVEALGRLRHRKINMETNLRNFKGYLRDQIFENRFVQLWRILGESSVLAIEQIKVDLEYFQTRNDESNLNLQTLSALVDVERGKMERLLFAILGLVGLVLSLIDGFSEEFSWQLKAAIVITGTILGGLIFYLGRGRWSSFWNSLRKRT